jgi:hypothetical protein
LQQSQNRTIWAKGKKRVGNVHEKKPRSPPAAYLMGNGDPKGKRSWSSFTMKGSMRFNLIDFRW